VKSRFQLDDRLTHAAALFATVLGTTKVVGILSGVWILTDISNTFGISPAPAPYERVSNVKPADVSIGQAFGCEDASGNVTWHRWNHLVRGAIPGPHRRGVTFLSYFKAVGKYASENDNPRMDTLTHYYFCHNGPIANAADCPAEITAVLFRYINPNTGILESKKRVPCIP
jgi:hypothetical protein